MGQYFQMLLATAPYSPGKAPLPDLSLFVNDEEEGYIPDDAKTIKSIQEAANMVCQTVSGPTEQGQGDTEDLELEELTAIEKAEPQEKAYMEELAQEITPTEKEQLPSRGGEEEKGSEEVGKKAAKKSKKKGKKRSAEDVAKETRAMSEILIPRKHRHMYNVVKTGEKEQAAKVQKLGKKRDAIKKKGKKV